MSTTQSISEKANLIWSIADKLTGSFKPHEYGYVILPFTVIRRFDCILEPYHKALMEKMPEIEKMTEQRRPVEIKKTVGGYPFYNTFNKTLKEIAGNSNQLENNFKKYLDCFSDNIKKDILAKFDFEKILDRLIDKGLLGEIVKEFVSPKADFGEKISNIEMGYVFEELIRKFSEAENSDAGQHYTPREVIELMTEILFADDAELNADKQCKKLIYDPACGTGGMLTVAAEYLKDRPVQLEYYGQEINDETYAICKADMLIKSKDVDYAKNIKNGNTLTQDGFKDQEFDYILSNPPFGREWKIEKDDVQAEHDDEGYNGRFGPGLPPVSDSQTLFSLNILKKMAKNGKAAVIHNGSPLFSGDAGSGVSEIRKYILENDLLDAIIALPNDIFYNTGISTYIWIYSKRKPENRKNKVILINANELYEKRRKALGNKRNDLSDENIAMIKLLYNNFAESEYSKIFDTTDFGYTKITVERPLRLSVEINDKKQELFSSYLLTKLENKLDCEEAARKLNNKTWNDYNQFIKEFEEALPEREEKGKKKKLKLGTKEIAAIRAAFTTVNKDAEKVILKQDKDGIQYEPNTDLRDTENVPLKDDIQKYFEKEVLPFAPDAWIDENKNVVGYEIPFTRYFYKYEAPKPSAEIMDEIKLLEKDLMTSLSQIMGE